MDISRNLCEKLYQEVKAGLQQEFIRRGKTFRGSETSIWKLMDDKAGKTQVQIILEEQSKYRFSGKFNSMYLWKKRDEVQTKEKVSFQEDYLQLFTKFLGFSNPQEYVREFSLTLHNFFGIKNEGKIIVIQPIFDATKEVNLAKAGKSPLANEQTVDSRDTECLLDIITLFHDYNQTLPQRLYDQDVVTYATGQFQLDDTFLNQNKINCIFSIGFYSNYFFRWVLQQQASAYVEYIDNPVRFRLRYFNEVSQEPAWTTYYMGDESFDAGFLLKLPVRFSSQTIICYFFCGIENIATRAMTSYLCKNWKTIQTKQDAERDSPIGESPFSQLFRVSKTDPAEYYCEKIIRLDF